MSFTIFSFQNVINSILENKLPPPPPPKSDMVLSFDKNNNYVWTDNNSNKPIVFYIHYDKEITFLDNFILSNEFISLSNGNFILDEKSNKKVLFKISFIYKWANNLLPPDFEIKILVNNQEKYRDKHGLSDYINTWNKISNEILLDIKKNDKISIILYKNNNESNILIIKENSFYKIELL